MTPDHVNPEAPWPALARLAAETAAAGKTLAPRLAVHPRWLAAAERWIEIPADGKSTNDYEAPAPGVRIVAPK